MTLTTKKIKSYLGNALGYKETRQFLVLLLVVVLAGFSIVYSNIKTYDSRMAYRSGYSDSLGYLSMYFGESGSDIGAYRILVPALARLMPDLPSWLLHPGISDPVTSAIRKFGMVNFFFLIGTCAALYFVQLGFGMSYFECFLGTVLFLGSQSVVRGIGIPMTDAAFYFFLALCIIAIQRDDLLLLLFATAVGVLAKELVLLLAVPFIVVSLRPRKRKAMMLLAVIPAIAVYIAVRMAINHVFPQFPPDKCVSGQVFEYFDDQMIILTTPNGLVNLFLSFGPSWFPAVYALIFCDVPKLLKRMSWLILIVFAGVLFLFGNLGRSTFSAFPVVIPLAAIGLNSWLESARKQKKGAR